MMKSTLMLEIWQNKDVFTKDDLFFVPSLFSNLKFKHSQAEPVRMTEGQE